MPSSKYLHLHLLQTVHPRVDEPAAGRPGSAGLTAQKLAVPAPGSGITGPTRIFPVSNNLKTLISSRSCRVRAFLRSGPDRRDSACVGRCK